MFLLLTETTGKILQTTLRSYLKIVHLKMNPKVFLKYCTFSSNMLHSQSLPLNKNCSFAKGYFQIFISVVF